jgi:FixJ family two-component response regulator
MSKAREQVVVVEDDRGMKEAIQRVLAASGFEVTGFDSAEVALQDRRTLDACCLVLDIHLPGLSGIELYERFLAVGRNPPVIFITAHDDAFYQEQATRLGALGFLIKPFSGHELSAVVAKAFE